MLSPCDSFQILTTQNEKCSVQKKLKNTHSKNFWIRFVGAIGNERAMKLNDAELIGRLQFDKGPLKHNNRDEKIHNPFKLLLSVAVSRYY